MSHSNTMMNSNESWYKLYIFIIECRLKVHLNCRLPSKTFIVTETFSLYIFLFFSSFPHFIYGHWLPSFSMNNVFVNFVRGHLGMIIIWLTILSTGRLKHQTKENNSNRSTLGIFLSKMTDCCRMLCLFLSKLPNQMSQCHSASFTLIYESIRCHSVAANFFLVFWQCRCLGTCMCVCVCDFG